MYAKIFILFCAISAVLAQPIEELNEGAAEAPLLAQYEDFEGYPVAAELVRLPRRAQFDPSKVNVWAQGGGNPGQGVDIQAKVGAPVWTSNNGRHIVGADLGYAQHLGGPYGNSRPVFTPGASYTFRF